MKNIKLFDDAFIDKLEADSGWTDELVIQIIQMENKIDQNFSFKCVYGLFYYAFDRTFLLMLLFTISWS